MLCPMSFTPSSLESGVRCQMMLQPVRDITETVTLYIFCDNIKCAVFQLNVLFGRLSKDGKY